MHLILTEQYKKPTSLRQSGNTISTGYGALVREARRRGAFTQPQLAERLNALFQPGQPLYDEHVLPPGLRFSAISIGTIELNYHPQDPVSVVGIL
jgi:hypothetical protein